MGSDLSEHVQEPTIYTCSDQAESQTDHVIFQHEPDVFDGWDVEVITKPRSDAESSSFDALLEIDRADDQCFLKLLADDTNQFSDMVNTCNFTEGEPEVGTLAVDNTLGTTTCILTDECVYAVHFEQPDGEHDIDSTCGCKPNTDCNVNLTNIGNFADEDISKLPNNFTPPCPQGPPPTKYSATNMMTYRQADIPFAKWPASELCGENEDGWTHDRTSPDPWQHDSATEKTTTTRKNVDCDWKGGVHSPIKKKRKPAKIAKEEIPEISMELLKTTFHLPRERAAAVLHIGCTFLKKLCRKKNIKRWPSRKLASISNHIDELHSMHQELLPDHVQLQEAMQSSLDKARKLRQAIYEDMKPGDTEHPADTRMPDLYREQYNFRRQMTRVGVLPPNSSGDNGARLSTHVVKNEHQKTGLPGTQIESEWYITEM